MKPAEATRALFLDRDGVIVRDVGFPHKKEHLNLCDGIVHLLLKAQSLGYRLIVVTNQSGLARGLFSIEEYEKFSKDLSDLLHHNGVHDLKTYYCPHHIEGVIKKWAVDCNCRKPNPGLINRAARELNISKSASILIGDRLSDLQAASAAGLGRYYLVGNREGNFFKKIQRYGDPRANKKFGGYFQRLSDLLPELDNWPRIGESSI